VDLIMVTQAANSASGGFGLQILINQGNGTLVDETAARVPASTIRDTGPFYAFIRFADFNGDGWEDLYGDSNSGGDGSYPRVWLNNGNGTWTPVAPAVMPSQSTTAILHAVDFEGDGRPDLLRLGFGGTGTGIGYLSFLNRTARTAFATMSLSPSRLNFATVNNGGALTSQTPAQRLALTQSGPGTVTWTATASQPWITVSPSAGAGSTILQVSITNAGAVLPPSGSLSGTIAVTTSGVTNAPTATVFLSVLAPAQATAPRGLFDTPVTCRDSSDHPLLENGAS